MQGKYNITYVSAKAVMYEGFMIEIANTAQHKMCLNVRICDYGQR